MEGGVVIDIESHNIGGNKPKGAKMVKGSMVGNIQRRTLADISNLPRRNQDVKSTLASVDAKQYIDKLRQENVTLVKLLEDRNKIIELSAIELQKLRINYQKVQQQNLQLAQANSQMLAELNLVKDKLKALQHELGCKSSLLKARELEYKDKTKTVGREIYPKVGSIKCNEVADFSEVGKGDNSFSNSKRKRQSKIRVLAAPETAPIEPVQAKVKMDEKRAYSRRQSAGLKNSGEQEPTEDLSESFKPGTAEPVQTKAKIDEMRLCLRRQSARLGNCGEWEPTEDFSERLAPSMVQTAKADKKRVLSKRRSARFKPQELAQERNEGLLKIHNTKLSVSPLHSDSTNERNESHAANGAPGPENQEQGRLSVRPLRRAAEKVQSYKEIPLNVKMRRAE